MSTFTYPAPAPSRVLRLPRLSRGGAQVALFFLAYLVYSGARYFTIGDLGDATNNAHWIVRLEDTLGVGIESAVQTALSGTVVLWALNHVYLAAQLVVLPGAQGGERDEADQPGREAPPAVPAGALLLALAAS